MKPGETAGPDLVADAEKRLFTLRQKLARFSNDPVFHNQLGLTQGAAGHMQHALTAFDRALALCPTYGEAHMNRGFALEILGRADEALASYAAAATLTPQYTEATQRAQQLQKTTGKAAAMNSWPEPQRGMFARIKDRLTGSTFPPDEIEPPQTEAEARAALSADPCNFRCASHFGTLLSRQGRHLEAEHFLRYALRGAPAMVDAVVSLAELLETVGRLSEAVTTLASAMTSGVSDPRLAPLLLRFKQATCDWDGFDALLRKALEAIAQTPGSTRPLTAICISDEASNHLACAQAYGAGLVSRARTPSAAGKAIQKSRLTLGYMSAEFHQHAGATLLAELFGLHDRRRFKVITYPLWTDDGGDLRRRIRHGSDRMVDLWGLSAPDGAAQIAADNVDILIDLSGYTRHGRPDILALRPAPIQVNYLGYPGTFGAAFADYAIVDPVITPHGEDQWFTEKLVRLPWAYQINDRKRPRPEPQGTRKDHGLPEAGVVFCNFNVNDKLTPVIFDSWMRILHAVPGSALWLFSASHAAGENLRREATKRGLAPERLVLAPMAPYREHIARYALADLFLDTLPYNAHTTTSESLWMGCPLLTCMGRAFAGRVAASLLTAAGYPELITHSLAEYESTAISLGNNPAKLAQLRAALEKTRTTCRLFDTPAVVKQLESAYGRMWDLHAAGRPPEAFAVGA